MNVAFIIPCFNEANAIKSVIDKIIDKGDIYIIDNGSTDNTLDIITNYKVFLIRNNHNLGYDSAIEQGMRLASKNNAKFLITLDGDGQHNLADFEKIISNLNSGFDLVVSNRNIKARFMEKVFSFIMKNRYNISDPLSGLKGYKMELFEKYGFKKNFNSIGTYLMMKILKNQHRYIEINYNILFRNGSSRFGSSLIVNLKILIIIIITQLLNF